ncbi:WD repeat domain 54 [Columba livia]|uniref:WD repeat domain 54 n=1 Tax=Columba livia TaxID=8932 RepID=A0A2I0LI40_COLLI|nr:WD repeat domain 54 [Columba livia]
MGGSSPAPDYNWAAWCALPARVLLVLTSQRGVQMYEADGSIMVYWHALDVSEHPPAQAVFARGIAAAGGRFICVGTSSGLVLVFDIPPKGTNVTVSQVLEQHRDAITDIAAELGQAPDGAGDLVTADDAGTLCTWSTGEEFTLRSKIPAFGVPPCLLSGAEDSFVHVWQLSTNPDTEDIEIQHCHAECVTDTQVCGACFCDPQGDSFAVTGYDLSEILRYSRV